MPAPGANGPVLEIAQPTLIELGACARTMAGAAMAAVVAPIALTTWRRFSCEFMDDPSLCSLRSGGAAYARARACARGGCSPGAGVSAVTRARGRAYRR